MTATHIGLVNNGIVDRTRVRCDGVDWYNATEEAAHVPVRCDAGVHIDTDALFAEMTGEKPETIRQQQLDAFIAGAKWTTVHFAGQPDRHYCTNHTPKAGGVVVDYPSLDDAARSTERRAWLELRQLLTSPVTFLEFQNVYRATQALAEAAGLDFADAWPYMADLWQRFTRYRTNIPKEG